MIFGKGLRPDTPHRQRMYGAFRSGLSESSLPSSASLARFEAPILDQGQTGSCTGHGTVQLLVASFAAAGRPLPWVPSPDGIYRDVRCQERASGPDGRFPPLTDSGGMPSDIVTVLRTCGIRKMVAPTPDGRFSDVDPSTVNREPRLDELESEALSVVTGQYAIDASVPGLITLVRAAIASGFGVGLPVFVDSRFEQWSGSSPVNDVDLADPKGGGHWLALLEYVTSSAGSTTFAGPNSWGGWGARALVDGNGCPNGSGHWRGTDAWLQKAAASSLVIFQVEEASS